MTDKLSTYRAKRDFRQTREPEGGRARSRRSSAPPRLRFVIQKHAARRLHYDLRLELDGVFKSWAVTRGPSLDPADKRLAVEVEDHPLEYGDFEGTIPQGQYGGGTVQLWDRGYWLPEGERSPEQALAAGDLKFTLDGERLHGSWVLVRIRNDRSGSKRTNWLLIKHRDEAADPAGAAALLEEDRSVASGRSMAADCRRQGQRPETIHAGLCAGQTQRACRCSLELEPERRARAARARPQPSQTAARRRRTCAAQDVHARLHRAAAVQPGRATARCGRLGSRNQARWLSPADAGSARQGAAADAQGSRLDAEVSGDRAGGAGTARLHHRWRGRGAERPASTQLRRSAGGAFRARNRAS